MRRRNRIGWVVVLVFQATLLSPAVISADNAGPSLTHQASEPCAGCPDCIDSGCVDHSCSAPCGAVVTTAPPVEIAFFLTAETLTQPSVTFLTSPIEPPLHPPPIR
jgi:hypothetical protein